MKNGLLSEQVQKGSQFEDALIFLKRNGIYRADKYKNTSNIKTPLIKTVP